MSYILNLKQLTTYFFLFLASLIKYYLFVLKSLKFIKFRMDFVVCIEFKSRLSDRTGNSFDCC